MKIYELTQEDLEVLCDKYRQITNDGRFKTPELTEVRNDLIQ